MELQQDHEDQITWTQTAHGEYTTVSAYKAQFNGCISTPTTAIIWKTWAPKNANSSHGLWSKTGYGHPTD
jgi:hypothetical protein